MTCRPVRDYALMILPVSSSDLRSLRIQFHPPPPCVLYVACVAADIIVAPPVSWVMVRRQKPDSVGAILDSVED